MALGVAALVGCSSLGHYVWVQDYEQSGQPQKGFVIRPGDVIQMRMFGQEQFNTRAKVREDGRISLPLLNDVEAAGYSPMALGQQLETRYKDFVKVPAVTISVEEVRPLAVSVAGEVVRAGVVSAERGATLLHVLLLAGGPNDFAHRDRIFVLRTNPHASASSGRPCCAARVRARASRCGPAIASSWNKPWSRWLPQRCSPPRSTRRSARARTGARAPIRRPARWSVTATWRHRSG
jgi:polysaccharide export outer membrane protein